MRVKILVIDLDKVPENWELDKWMKYMEMMKLPLKNLDGFKVVEINVSLWNYIRHLFGFNLKFNSKEHISLTKLAKRYLFNTPKHIAEAFNESRNESREGLIKDSFVVSGEDCGNIEDLEFKGKRYFAHKKMIEMMLEKLRLNNSKMSDVKVLWCIPGSCSPTNTVDASCSQVDGYEVHFLYKKNDAV